MVNFKNICFGALKKKTIPLTLAVIAYPVAGFTDKETSPCESQWYKIVKEVRSTQSVRTTSDTVIVFVGSDGEAFNCLNENIPERTLSDITFWGRMRAGIMNDPERYGTRPPANFCNLGQGKAGTLRVITVHLPYQLDVLMSPTCVARTKNFHREIKDLLLEEN